MRTTTSKWMWRGTVAVAVLTVLQQGCAGEPEPQGVVWQAYRSGALDQARERGLPVILDFYADWCVPCLEMEKYTFSDPRVAEFSRGFVNLRLDLSSVESFQQELPPQARPLVERFQVRGLPTMVFVDGQGNVVMQARVMGYLDAEEFLSRMELAKPPG